MKKLLLLNLGIAAACAVALRIAFEAMDVSHGVDLAIQEMGKRVSALEKKRSKR